MTSISRIGLEGWLEVVSSEKEMRDEFERLHQGEIAAICFALETKTSWLLVDDGDARQAAKTLGLRIMGVLGMIVWAKRHGHIEKAADCIEQLRRKTNFRISSEVVRQILLDLGEG